jgi:hypothetical protein
MTESRLYWPIPQLCRLSGEDDQIILREDVDTHVAGQFAGIGLLVMVIFFLSVYSSIHFLVNLLSCHYLIAMLVGLIWGTMIANIYYLLLFTITPAILRGRDHAAHGIPREETTEKKTLSRVSLFFRLLFVILLAMIIAQPWLVTLFDTSRWVEQSRREYRAAFARLAAGATLSEDSGAIAGQRTISRRRVDALLSANNFYTRRIQLVHSHYAFSWVVTLVVVLFFILPIWLKYQVRNNSNFYQVKERHERGMVLRAYEDFKERFAAISVIRFGEPTNWYESCVDPPFNTRKKEEVQAYAEQQQLLARIYENEEEGEANKYLIRETTT